MKHPSILSAFLGLFFFQSLQAQQGEVKVNVTDADKKPLDGIMVELIKTHDSTMVKYAFTGQNGEAQFTDVPYDSYKFFISQTGYDNYFSSEFTIDESHKEFKTLTIQLNAKSLGEVVVVGKTPVIQHFAGKTVVNVEQSPLNAVGSIYDVLKRSPGIMIDPNENISMHGKQNVMVMIDGRITPMSATDLASYLKALPSESVEKIEFITNPSSKYDANGTAGIINIILKRNKAFGTVASIHAGYSQGIYPKTNDGFTISKRTKKFNIFSNYNYTNREGVNQITLNSNYYIGKELQSSTYQNEYLKTPGSNNLARIGADFYASDKTTIGFIGDGSIRTFNAVEGTTTNNYDSLGHPVSYNIANSGTPNKTYNLAGNLNMKHTFDSTDRELLLNLDYADYNNKGYQNVLTDYFNLDNSLATNPVNLYGYLPGNLDIYSFKADYDGQLGKKDKLEAGIKSSYVKTDNNVMIYDGINNYAPIDTTQSNHFIYSENINAAYLTYSRDIPKADVELGLRAEQTISKGDQVTTGETFTHNYIQLFPTLFINDSIAHDHILGISADRRIDRPTYDQLNPFRLYINPTFYLQGNPYLIPQNAYSLSLSDTYKDRYTLTLSYTRTLNAITTVIFPFPGELGIAEQTEENLTSLESYNSSLSVVQPVGKWLNIILGADAFISRYTGDLSSTPLNTSRFIWDANATNTITINKILSFDVFGYYGSGYDLGYLFIQGSWDVSAGVKINVLKGKGTISLNANDIFWTDLTKGVTTFSNFNQTVFVRRDTRIAGVSFTYKFGNNSAASKSLRSKGGAEEEKKRADKTS